MTPFGCYFNSFSFNRRCHASMLEGGPIGMNMCNLWSARVAQSFYEPSFEVFSMPNFSRQEASSPFAVNVIPASEFTGSYMPQVQTYEVIPVPDYNEQSIGWDDIDIPQNFFNWQDMIMNEGDMNWFNPFSNIFNSNNFVIGPKTDSSEKFTSFDEALSHHESRGNYKSDTNRFGYIGKYQMGEALLHDIGYYNNDGDLYTNDWVGSWSGKKGIKSKEDFLNSPKVQDEAYQEAKKHKWKLIKHYKLDKYIGEVINGVEITASGLLGAVYAQGCGNWNKDNPKKDPQGLIPYLESNGKVDPTDGNGLHISSAIARYSGFDISDVTAG